MPTETRGVVAALNATFHADGTARIGATSPLELRGPFTAGHDAPTYLLRNVTAGVFTGDRYDVRLATEAGARARIAAPSATKVHGMPSGYAASRLAIDVADGSTLTYTPSPTILQKDADFTQATTIRLQAGGTLVYSEIVVLGRVAHGERLAFLRFASDLSIFQSETPDPTYVERFTLDPRDSPGDTELALNGYSVLGTLITIGAQAQICRSSALPDGCVAGATALPGDDAIIVRALAHRADVAWQALTSFGLVLN